MGPYFFMTKPDCTDEAVDAVIESHWKPYLESLEKHCAKSKEMGASGKFLVGDCMTLADITAGSLMMRFCHNESGR